jgi:hypothetical protein
VWQCRRVLNNGLENVSRVLGPASLYAKGSSVDPPVTDCRIRLKREHRNAAAERRIKPVPATKRAAAY